jgi:hypothetical protein
VSKTGLWEIMPSAAMQQRALLPYGTTRARRRQSPGHQQIPCPAEVCLLYSPHASQSLTTPPRRSELQSAPSRSAPARSVSPAPAARLTPSASPRPPHHSRLRRPASPRPPHRNPPHHSRCGQDARNPGAADESATPGSMFLARAWFRLVRVARLAACAGSCSLFTVSRGLRIRSLLAQEHSAAASHLAAGPRGSERPVSCPRKASLSRTTSATLQAARLLTSATRIHPTTASVKHFVEQVKSL